MKQNFFSRKYDKAGSFKSPVTFTNSYIFNIDNAV